MSDTEQSILTQIRLLARMLRIALEDTEQAKSTYQAATSQSDNPRDWIDARTQLRRALEEVDDISQRITEQALKLIEGEPCATKG